MSGDPPLLFSDPSDGRLLRRRWKLHVVEGVDAGRQCSLDRSPALLGAAPAATLVLTDDTVSRYHLEIDISADGLRLRDLDSTNGSFVRGARIKDAFIEANDTFRLGKTTVRAESTAEEPPDEDSHLVDTTRFGSAFSTSEPMRELFRRLRRAAGSESSVTLGGPAGAGKSLLARAIHGHSARRKGPLISVSLRAIASEQELEVALFGDATRASAFERASGGSLLIDDFDRLSSAFAARVLAVIERGEVHRTEEPRVRRVDVRYLATTRRPRTALGSRLERRLGVIRVDVPGLGERPEDAIALADLMWRAELGQPELGRHLKAALARCAWPANVSDLRRSLQALAERIARRDSLLGTALDDPTLEVLIAAWVADWTLREGGDVDRLAEAMAIPSAQLFEYLARTSPELELL